MCLRLAAPQTQNVFISGGKVLLGDFGLAKQLQRTFEMARTPIGTPYYMYVRGVRRTYGAV